jgi:hypothetical protein
MADVGEAADRTYVPSLVTALVISVISAWTIVASLVISQSTVQHLALGASLAIGGLALVGLTAHEILYERAERTAKHRSSEARRRGLALKRGRSTGTSRSSCPPPSRPRSHVSCP